MKTIREIYGEALAELGAENPDIIVLDCDVSSSTRSELFARAYPERFFNLGIAEGNMAAVAAGLALGGKIPFINSFAFLLSLRAADPIRSLIAYGSLNVKMMGAYAGLSDSYDGASHQSVEDIAVMRAIPGITVITVCDEYQTRAAVKACADYPGPVYIRLSRNEMPDVYNYGGKFKIGKANILKSGCDVTLIGCGLMTSRCVSAAEILSKDGITAEVIDMHTIKPLDKDALILSIRKTRAAVTAEEHSIIGGLGSAVAEMLSVYSPAPLEMVGIADKFGESGEYNALLEKFGLGVSDIVNAAKCAISRK
jgi:transketolase